LSEDEPEIGRVVGAPRHARWIRAALVFVVATVLAGCSSSGGTTKSKSPPDVVPSSTMATRPNIVFVLTDDLSSNLVPYMPNVRKMMRRGATFTNYFVTNSLCCPSRASIFTGLYPHSTGVYTNTEPDGGLLAFNSHGNPGRTFAVALQRRGYRTALMGKYLNGYRPDLQLQSSRSYIPKGWDNWTVAGDAYDGYNYRLNHNHHIVHYGGGPRAYITDVLARRAQKYITRVARSDKSRRPFALEISTFAPHSPYVFAPRDRNRFPRVRAPRTPAFGRHDTVGNPRWLDYPPLTEAAVAKIDENFRRRVLAVQAIDRMVGALQRQLRRNGLASNTYFVFSSDNGYHMGEHRLRAGKMTAFDTDIRVPLVIVGPGIRPGMRIDALAANIDLAPTFEELAGHTPSPAVEGRSLVPLLEGRQPANWRRAVLVEHRGPSFDPTDPDYQEPDSGNPPSYKAIRLEHAVYVEYVDGEREYYDIATDPFELRNAYEDLTPVHRALLQRYVARLVRCHGAASCHRADQLLPPPSKPHSTPTTFRPIAPRS
jgi:arylsulfatase A-like enzyme